MKTLKKILILYYSKNENIENKKPFDTQKTRLSIERLFAEGEKGRIKFYRTPLYLYDEKKKYFKKAWSFENRKWTIVDNITPDVVYDKCEYSPALMQIKNKIAHNFRFINDPFFDMIASNKIATHALLKEWSPQSFLIRNNQDLRDKIGCIKSSKFVIKPLFGYGGIGVKVLNAEEAKNLPVKEASVLQEFIDSSKGIKGIVKSLHDLRILIFNKEIFGSYIRIPQKGSFLANIGQGGKRIVLDKKDVPLGVLDIVKEIIKRFDSFDYLFYSADFIFDIKQRPYLIEINSRPGFIISNIENEKTKIFSDRYYSKTIEFFGNIKAKNN